MSEEEDDFDWDSSLGIDVTPERLTLPVKEELTLKSVLSTLPSKDEDWTNDFAESLDDLEKDDTSKPLKIRGIKADPKGEAENWDDAFAFQGTQIEVTPKKFKAPLQRVGSAMVMPKQLRLVSQLNELLHKFPHRQMKEEIYDEEFFDSKGSQENEVEKEIEAKTNELTQAKAKQDFIGEIKAQINLGKVYFKYQKFTQAENHYTLAYEILKKKSD